MFMARKTMNAASSAGEIKGLLQNVAFCVCAPMANWAYAQYSGEGQKVMGGRVFLFWGSYGSVLSLEQYYLSDLMV